MTETPGHGMHARTTSPTTHAEERQRTPTDGHIGRRGLLLGLAGAGAGAAACGVVSTIVETTVARVIGKPEAAVGARPLDGGSYPDRDASFAMGVATASQPTALTPAVFAGAAAAAEATKVTVPTILATENPTLHLLRRATFGITRADVDEVTRVGIDRWLQSQLDPASIPDGEADQVWSAFPTVGLTPQQIRGAIPKYSWDAMFEYAQATLARQIWSRRQLYEVMVDFWANHLNMPMPSDAAWDVGTSYHNDVIRRHALGTFTDLLLAAMRHPAMLTYLDNDKSRKTSVNENLGRELLELHTVGVHGGYTETDVRNSAYILSGRTIDRDSKTFKFDPERHWTGPVHVLDFRHANPSDAGGLGVGDEYLRYLAGHPATARSIARKLAVRFVADNPPAGLVDRLATAYIEHQTAIKPVLHTMFSSTEFWASVGQKCRRPLENVVATARVLDVSPGVDGGATRRGISSLYWSLNVLGHRPLAWSPPNGYPDVQAAWVSASGMLEQWNLHRALVHGWRKELRYTKFEALVQAPTVGEYVRRLCQRLLFQEMRPDHRDALLGFVGEPAGKSFAGSKLEGLAGHLAPLVLDSPYFALR